jgi:hypothetical protein
MRVRSLLRRRLGYSTVGALLVWLAVITVSVSLLIALTTTLPTD